VRGERLDVAEGAFDASGLRYAGVDGAFGIVVGSRRLVCSQRPVTHTLAWSVTLDVARSRPPLVPDVVGESLEAAEDQLERAGISVREQSIGGEEVIVDSFWAIGVRSPGPGTRAASVVLSVAHDCSEYGR
jgi:hypothetical protein